jgi:hypothetical protein
MKWLIGIAAVMLVAHILFKREEWRQSLRAAAPGDSPPGEPQRPRSGDDQGESSVNPGSETARASQCNARRSESS